MNHLSKVHVPSGTFVCDKSKPALLQAYLSSCVGVAAFDPENRVGGLSHFLLPEPISHCLPDDEGKYASTGLPLFIESLLAQGASLKKLKVTVAGGAFSGALSHQDLHLDIGGRTAEMVKDILTRMQIAIERWETGGFFHLLSESQFTRRKVGHRSFLHNRSQEGRAAFHPLSGRYRKCDGSHQTHPPGRSENHEDDQRGCLPRICHCY